MKKEDFIGVWKLKEYGEGKIITSKTHLVVKDDVLWEVHPKTIYYENEPGPEVKYDFEEGSLNTPAKLSLENGFKYLVKKNGDTLYLKLGPIYGHFPKDFKDQGNLGIYQLETQEIAKVIGVLPEKVKVQELKIRGFGTLKYDSNLNWWTGCTKFQENEINLNISADEENQLKPLDEIKEKLKQLEGISFEKIAADHLLSLFNDSWNNNDSDISHTEFASKVLLESITLEISGGTSIGLTDGGLFAGHSINISLDAENNTTDVGIMG